MFPVKVLDLLESIVELLKFVGSGQSGNFGLPLSVLVLVQFHESFRAR